MKYHFIISGWNCSQWAVDCINSVLNQQTECDFDIFAVDDFSTDNTWQKLQTTFGSNPLVFLHRNNVNVGAAFCRYICIHNDYIQPDDVCLLVGMDDKLEPFALARVDTEYKNGAQVTFGNWKNYDGYGNHLRSFLPETCQKRDFFRYHWVSTALQSFKANLFRSIPKEDFIIDGSWIKNCTELPTMWGVMERAEFGTIKRIPDYIYLYNNKNVINTYYRFGNADKKKISQEIIRRKELIWPK